MKKKLVIGTVVLLLTAVGGFAYWNQSQETALQETKAQATQQYNKINEAIKKVDYETARQEINELADLGQEDQVPKYLEQVDLMAKAKEQTADFELTKAGNTLEKLGEQEELLAAIQEKQAELTSELAEKTNEIAEAKKRLDEGIALSEKKDYQAANDLLKELTEIEAKGEYRELTTKATDQINKNQQALEKAEAEREEAKKAAALTEEEALEIVKMNLPDLFDYGRSWASGDSDETDTFTFYGVNNGPFRSILVVKPINDQQVFVTETRLSNGGEDQVSEYTFDRIGPATPISEPVAEQEDPLSLAHPQKFFDAYASFTAKGINVMPANRGTAVYTEEMIAASGYSAERFYQLEAGIDDYFWHLWSEGELSEEQVKELSLQAKNKLLNGDYAGY